MQSITIFNTPVLTTIVRPLFRLAQRFRGWSVKGDRPDLDKCVYIAAPHTSNWDFLLMLSVCFTVGIRPRWIGKHTLFPPIVGSFMRWLGGISIDRRKKSNTVEQMCQHYERLDSLELIITPEGTRGRVDDWKTGFYRIAVAANVPIIPASVHVPGKVVEIGEPFHPTGDYETDLAEIMKFYEGKVGFRPENWMLTGTSRTEQTPHRG